MPSNGLQDATEEDLQKWEKCGKPALNQKINGKANYHNVARSICVERR